LKQAANENADVYEVEEKILEKDDMKTSCPLGGQMTNEQQSNVEEQGEPNAKKVQKVVAEVRRRDADEDRKRSSLEGLEGKEMILVGTILCPLQIGQKMGHKFLPKTMRYEADEVVTNKELECQGKWQGYEDMLQTEAVVSRCKETKDEKTMEMKSQGKAKQGDCIPSMEKYVNVKGMSYFWFVFLILLQAYGNMMEIPSVGKMAMIGKSHVLEGACYCFLILLIWLMSTTPKRRRRRYRNKAGVLKFREATSRVEKKSHTTALCKGAKTWSSRNLEGMECKADKYADSEQRKEQ
jgi:hypothetical protein